MPATELGRYIKRYLELAHLFSSTYLLIISVFSLGNTLFSSLLWGINWIKVSCNHCYKKNCTGIYLRNATTVAELDLSPPIRKSKMYTMGCSSKQGFKAEDIRKKYGISRTCILTLLRQKDDFVEKIVSSPVAGSCSL